MTRFDQLSEADQARRALEAIHRVMSGLRMREGDAEALAHAAELVAVHIPHVPRDVSPEELARANDFFDRLALGQKGAHADLE